MEIETGVDFLNKMSSSFCPKQDVWSISTRNYEIPIMELLHFTDILHPVFLSYLFTYTPILSLCVQLTETVLYSQAQPLA